MINMNDRQNEYWNASPLRPKSGSNIAQWLLHMRSLFLPFTLSKDLNRCVYEDTCKDGYSEAYKCVYLIVQSQQKRNSVLLSHRKRRRTHIALLFVFQRFKISCFKTAVLKNTWPCHRCSPSFSNELLVLSWLVVLSPVTSRGGRRIKIAVTQWKWWKGIP